LPSRLPRAGGQGKHRFLGLREPLRGAVARRTHLQEGHMSGPADAPNATSDAGEVRAVRMAVVGASAGGVDALLALLSGLPAGWTLPVVVVLHLPEQYQSRLAELFSQRLPFAVREAEDKLPVADGTLYFAPSGYHLSIESDLSFSLSCEP